MDEAEVLIGRVAESIRQGHCLPFIGAGVSAWEGSAISVDEKAALRGVPRKSALDAINHVDALSRSTLLKAGCSSAWGSRRGAPPTWYLRLCLLCMLGETARGESLGAPLSTIATLVRHTCHREYAHLLVELFARCRPNSLHEILARLPIHYFVTTNYDGCLEAARQEFGKPLTPITVDQDLVWTGFGPSSLFKIHGNLEGASTKHISNDSLALKELENRGVVLDNIDYWRFPDGRSLVMDWLRVLLACSQMVFIGYGLGDFNIVEQLHRLRPFQHLSREPILVLSHATGQEKQLWRDRGVKVLVADPKRFLTKVWRRYYDFSCLDESSGVVWIGQLKCTAELAVDALLRALPRNRDDDSKRKLSHVAEWPIFPGSLLKECDLELLQRCKKNKWIRRYGPAEENDEDAMWEFPLEIRMLLLDKLDDSRVLRR